MMKKMIVGSLVAYCAQLWATNGYYPQTPKYLGATNKHGKVVIEARNVIWPGETSKIRVLKTIGRRGSKTELKVDKEYMPWSGWYFPFAMKEMFQVNLGNNRFTRKDSPLDKYRQYVVNKTRIVGDVSDLKRRLDRKYKRLWRTRRRETINRLIKKWKINPFFRAFSPNYSKYRHELKNIALPALKVELDNAKAKELQLAQSGSPGYQKYLNKALKVLDHEIRYNPRTTDLSSGHCDAWAFASIMAPRPIAPITRGGVTFSIGDQTALLIKSFQFLKTKHPTFGEPNLGQGQVYNDLYPDQIYRLLQVYIKDMKRPFIIDHDSGDVRWNVPVYRYKAQFELTKKKNGKINHRKLKGAMWIFYASSRIKSSRIYTKAHFDYTGPMKWDKPLYTFEADATPIKENGVIKRYRIDRARWTESSKKDHPDSAMAPPYLPKNQTSMDLKADKIKNLKRVQRESHNPNISTAIVNEILYGWPAK